MAVKPAKAPARSRILDTAGLLFYAEGVHTVGIDRIIAEAGVAKATFYHHFKSKDALVVAYIEEQSRKQREAAEPVLHGTAPPRARLLSAYDHMTEFGLGATYRGCPFLNAAAEYPDPQHPVRRAVAAHRRWFRDEMRDLLAADGHADAERTADILLMLRDGLATGFDLDDKRRLRTTVREALERVLPAA